jgi:hypothetical protein
LAGAKTVKVIDYPFTNPVICLEKTGLKGPVAAAGGQLYTLNGGRDRYFRPVQIGGKVLAAAEYSKDVLDADVFINMPILKHHVGTMLTMGMKNLMGLVWDRGFFHRTDLHRCIAETVAFKKPHLTIVTDKPAVFEAGRVYLSKLAYAGDLSVTNAAPENTDGMVAVITNDAKLYMPLAELVDLDKERERIVKEHKKAQEDLEKLNAKLSNEGFVSKAPAAVVNAERERVEKLKALIENLSESLKALG